MVEKEIKKSVGRMIGDAVVNGYLKKTGGFHELNRIRSAVGVAPIAKGKPFSRSVTFNVNDSALYEVMQEHGELNPAEGNLYSGEFWNAVHRDWVTKTGRGLNEGEKTWMVEKLSELRRLGTHEVELDMIIDYLQEHEDLIDGDDPTCQVAVDFVTKKVSTQIVRQCSRGAYQGAAMEAQAIWRDKFGDSDE